MATSPAFASTPKVGVATISTANTASDGTGTIGTIFTAGTSGSRVDKIVVVAISASTSLGMIRLFIHNGTTAFLYKEIPVSAGTSGVGSAAMHFGAELDLEVLGSALPIFLPTGYSIRASTHIAESFNVICIGADL